MFRAQTTHQRIKKLKRQNTEQTERSLRTQITERLSQINLPQSISGVKTIRSFKKKIRLSFCQQLTHIIFVKNHNNRLSWHISWRRIE